MSDFEEDFFDDDFNDTPPGLFPPETVPNRDDEDEDESIRLRPSAAPSFPRPTSFNLAPLAKLTLNAIAALTNAELLHNPNYRKLRRDHDHLASVLTTYVERDLAEFCTAKSEGLVPDIYQAVPRSVNSCCTDSCGADSRTSSLGPSDSTSQQTRIDIVTDKAIENLLEGVEAPVMRPHFLPKTILWDFEDCETNKSRPKMSLALRHPNGTKISNIELSNMRHSAELIVQKLINFVQSDAWSAARSGGPNTRTKTFIKKHFTAEYYRAVLDLEAEQKLLCLCSAHWKADTLITQVFLHRIAKVGAVTNSVPPTSPSSNQSSEPPTAFIPQSQEVAPMKVTKRALELSPGPKSPSTSHVQKRTKDNIVPVVSRQALGSRVPPTQNQYPTACKITPTFLNRTEMTRAEPAPTSLHPIHVDPLGVSVSCLTTSLTSFKEGEPSKQVTTLLEHVQFADPCSSDIDEDNTCQSWGHYQFTAGGISPASSLTNWQEVGSITTAFKLVAAAIKTCQEARLMCLNAGTLKSTGFISDVYLEKTLECLENCWVGAGGMLTSQNCVPLPTTPSYHDVAMSPPPRGPVIRIKWPAPADVAASKIPEVLTGTNSTNQSATTTEPMEPSAGLDEGTHACVASLKLLQVSELLAWFGDNKISIPKAKRKDDLIAVIVKSPEFASISESTVKEIIEKRKKKGSQKPLAALP
ncbi:hypothetical protein H4582DRAFT_2051286 [Lactarius indigo]|nr:hypothetical protein H4582DRAFT_2051286 [Lactarius indigo]